MISKTLKEIINVLKKSTVWIKFLEFHDKGLKNKMADITLQGYVVEAELRRVTSGTPRQPV